MEVFGSVFFGKLSHGCVGRRSILIERSFSDLVKVWKGVPWQKGRGVRGVKMFEANPKPAKQRNLLKGVVSKFWTSREPTQITETFLENCEILGWNVVQYRLWLVWLSWNPRCFHILLFQETHANIQAVLLDISFEVCNSNIFFSALPIIASCVHRKELWVTRRDISSIQRTYSVSFIYYGVKFIGWSS